MAPKAFMPASQRIVQVRLFLVAAIYLLAAMPKAA
jgi:hypothetical protein